MGNAGNEVGMWRIRVGMWGIKVGIRGTGEWEFGESG